MGWWWETPVQTLNSSGFYSLHAGMHSIGLLLSTRMHVYTKCPWKMKIKFEMTCLVQDQHLHNFFQHCQNMEMSEQASEGELVKYLKVLKAPLIWNALRKSQHTLYSCLIKYIRASCPSVAHFSMWHYSVFCMLTVNKSPQLLHEHLLSVLDAISVNIQQNPWKLYNSISFLEPSCHGGSCDGQFSAHRPQPAVLCPN